MDARKEKNCDITDCDDASCRICYPDEDFTNYKDCDQPMTNHSFDDEGNYR